MSRKFMQYFISHPWRCIISLFVFSIIFAMTAPEIVIEIVCICVLVLLLIYILNTFCCEEKEKQELQSMDKEDYEKKWMQYVDLVNEMLDENKYERNKLNTDWIQTFNQVIYAVATNQYLLRRKFNDFDIAACLVYSLTWNNNTDEDILFAFSCAKKVIREPKEYIRDLGYGHKLELNVENIFQKVNIYIPDETITTEALISIIRTYLTQKTESGIIQLSDFLHILYLKCK